MSALTRFAVQLRARLDGDTLTGHAAVFGQVARVPGGWEDLDPGAFDAVLDASSTDVRALVNHDASMLLGRQAAGTLRLKADDEGLAFEVDLPDTSYANDLRALVARGDLTGASFGFIPGKTRESRAPDGRARTTHTSVRELIDVSAVTFPAYSGAGVSLRHHDFGRVSARSLMIRARHRAHVGPGRGSKS